MPDAPLTRDLPEGGGSLKKAIGEYRKSSTPENLFRVLQLLRDSWVWIPCSAVLSSADSAAMEKLVKDAQENGGLESLVGRTITNQDAIRMVPDILQNGSQYFFPAFTSQEEMGEYGSRFSKVEQPFTDAIRLAENSRQEVAGIVINAFSGPFVVPKELFGLIAGPESAIRQP